MKFRFCLVAVAFISSLIAAEKAAEENYKQHCVECHGRDGKAKTRLGRKSGAKDLTVKEDQAKLTDEDAFKLIKFGRKNSKGEELMEAFGDRLTDKEISELVAYIRKFAQ